MGGKTQVGYSYNITNGLNAIGNGNYSGTIIDKNLNEIKSQNFITLLNQNREENTLWNKWKLGEDGYPMFE